MMIAGCFIVAALLMIALLIGAALLKAAAKPVPRPVPAVTAKGRPLDHCAFCGRLVAVRKRDGMPYRGRHACRNTMSGATAGAGRADTGAPTAASPEQFPRAYSEPAA